MVRDGYIYGLSLLAVAVLLVWVTKDWAWAVAPVLADVLVFVIAIVFVKFRPGGLIAGRRL